MPSSDRTLNVWCFEQLAGTLVDARPAMLFAYGAAWLTDGLPPLSHSLPLDGSFGPPASAAFFGGLLPEGVPRARLAGRLGVSDRNDLPADARRRGRRVPPLARGRPGQAAGRPPRRRTYRVDQGTDTLHPHPQDADRVARAHHRQRGPVPGYRPRARHRGRHGGPASCSRA
jgi:HipA-like protein